MKDVGSCTHSAVQLPKTVSKGRNTKDKAYIKQRKCALCDKKSTVKCMECNEVYCFPSLSKSSINLSCFYKHVHNITNKKRKVGNP